MILNFILSIVGFIAVLALTAGPVLAIVFFILWLTAKPEKKNKYKKLILIFGSTFAIGLLLIILTLVGYAVFSTMKNPESKPISTAITKEKSTKSELINKEDTPVQSIRGSLYYLADNLKIEDPETFSYPGCIMYHGTDGDINKWSTFDDARLKKIYTYLVTANSKYTLVKLDYSKNPYNASDAVYIVTCTCEQSKQVQAETNQLGLDFNNKLQHYPQLLCSE